MFGILRWRLWNVCLVCLRSFGPERIKDTPISEAAIAGSAIGAAITGLRPIVDVTFMDFITIALDAIVNNGAKIIICLVVV